MKLVLIPAGEFMMGQPGIRFGDEHDPPHRVYISKPFYLGIDQVTQEEYEKVMVTKSNSRPKATRNPADRVSWNDAVEFCRRLSVQEGGTYRLPTEAEWEYAWRAGSSPTIHEDHPIGQEKLNAWGLRMPGLLSEWCADWYAGDYYRQSPQEDPPGPLRGTERVQRGSPSGLCYDRGHSAPDYRGFGNGFRVVKTSD